MERTLHDVHRERQRQFFPSYIMTMDELKEYRTLVMKDGWDEKDYLRTCELRVKYLELREFYVDYTKYFNATKHLYESDTN